MALSSEEIQWISKKDKSFAVATMQKRTTFNYSILENEN